MTRWRNCTTQRPMRGWCMGLILLLASAAPALPDPYRLPDEELLVSDFGQLPGFGNNNSTLDGKTDVAGSGVLFHITLDGGQSGKMGIGDPWPTDSAAGLGWDPVLRHSTSLAYYDTYTMKVAYVSGPSGSTIDVSLLLNTGLTGPSGDPSGDSTNDTFWGGPWTTLSLGEEKNLTLDFGGAEAWNISDNQAPHTGGGLGWADGGIYAINERDRYEISNIGLQVADFDYNSLDDVSISLHLNAAPEPISLAFMGSAFVAAVAWRMRRKPKQGSEAG